MVPNAIIRAIDFGPLESDFSPAAMAELMVLAIEDDYFLNEETGFRAETFKRLGDIVPVPAWSDERIHIYLATGLTSTRQALERDEQLEVHEVQWEQALSMIDNGEIKDIQILGELQKLKAFSFAGSSTKIVDGDLSVLETLPDLAMLMFGSRRHYTHTLIKKWNWHHFNHPDKLLKRKCIQNSKSNNINLG